MLSISYIFIVVMEKVRELSESSSGDDQTPLHISLQAPTSKRQENKKRQRKRQKDTTWRAYCSTILYIRPRKTMELQVKLRKYLNG